jgi:hypothetical protein
MTEVEKTVSKVRRARVLFGVAIGAICLMAVAGFVGAILATVVNVQQDTKITRVEKSSACETDPAGAECRAVKRKSDEARPARDFCIGAEKIDHDGELLALTTCREARHRHARAAADALTRGAGGEGEATAPASGGSRGDVAPASPGSGDAPAPQGPGGDPAPGPPKGGSDTPSPAPTASSPPPSASPDGSTATNPPSAVTLPTSPAPANQPGLIQSTVQGVDEAVTPTVCAVAELLRHLC